MRGKLLKVLFVLLPIILIPILNLNLFHLEFLAIVKVILWYLSFLFLGLITFQVISSYFLDLGEDESYAISKIVGLLFIGIVSWYIGRVGLSFSPLSTTVSFLFLFSLSLFGYYKTKAWRVPSLNLFVIVESLFGFIFLFYLIISALRPELVSGEKHMDISLLSFLSRNSEYPIQDPWISGFKLNYYYFGYFVFSRIVNLFSIMPDIGFHLSFSTIPPLTALASYTLFSAIFKNRRTLNSALAILTIFVATPATFFMLFKHGANFDVRYFWDLTRTFSHNGAFVEYPLWSFIFGDLHPHVMVYPFVILTYYSLVKWLTALGSKENSLTPLYLLSLFSGATLVLSSWDIISIFVIALPFLVILLFTYYDLVTYELAKKIIVQLLIICLFAGVLFGPLFLSYMGGRAITLSINHQGFNELSGYLLQYGHWLSLLFLTSSVFLWVNRSYLNCRMFYYLIPSSVPLLLWFLVFYSGASVPNIGLAIITSVLIMFSATGINISRQLNSSYYLYAFSITIGSSILIIATQCLVFIDKINTLFKFGTHINLVLTLAVLTVLGAILISRYSKYLKYGIVVFISIWVVGALFNFITIPVVRDKTLKGGNFLRKNYPLEAGAINFINSNIKGQHILVEKSGNSYDKSVALISSYTGLSSFLGQWGHVTYGRGIGQRHVDIRKSFIRDLYSKNITPAVYRRLIDYGIRYIKIGPLEQKEYHLVSVEKFFARPDLFSLVYRYKEIVIFMVVK